MSTTRTRSNKTITRAPKVIAVSQLEEVLRSISRRSFSADAQTERAYIRTRLRGLWTPESNS